MPPTWIGVGGTTGEGEANAEDDPEDPTDTYEPPEPSPELKAVFAKIDALFAGMSRAEALAAVQTFYIDADHEPRLRQPLRLVRDDDPVDADADADADAAEDADEDVPEPAAPVREVDTLTQEDRERGNRMMEKVRSDRDQRREDGVRSLSRERFLRLRRRKGLPTPD